MAADILLYDTAQVPVGDDQRQHLELTREVAERFNHRYGETFVVPRAVVPPHGARVMDLQEPTRKMSKSVSSPQGSLYLMDTEADIERKIKRAVTDTDGEVRLDWEAKPGLTNLLEIFAALTGETPEAVARPLHPLRRPQGRPGRRWSSRRSRRSRPATATCAPTRGSSRRWRRPGRRRAEAVAGPVYERAASAMGL